MQFIIELRTKERVTVEAGNYKEAEERAASMARKANEKNGHGEVTEAVLLGKADHVQKREEHLRTCRGCCPCCGGHCSEFDGVSCGR